MSFFHPSLWYILHCPTFSNNVRKRFSVKSKETKNLKCPNILPYGKRSATIIPSEKQKIIDYKQRKSRSNQNILHLMIDHVFISFYCNYKFHNITRSMLSPSTIQQLPILKPPLLCHSIPTTSSSLPLKDFLYRYAPTTSTKILISLYACQCVQELHKIGIRHNGITPHAFLIHPEQYRVQLNWTELMKYASALIVSSENQIPYKEPSSSNIHQLNYGSPELIFNMIQSNSVFLLTSASDLWSLGLVLFEVFDNSIDNKIAVLSSSYISSLQECAKKKNKKNFKEMWNTITQQYWTIELQNYLKRMNRNVNNNNNTTTVIFQTLKLITDFLLQVEIYKRNLDEFISQLKLLRL